MSEAAELGALVTRVEKTITQHFKQNKLTQQFRDYNSWKENGDEEYSGPQNVEGLVKANPMLHTLLFAYSAQRSQQIIDEERPGKMPEEPDLRKQRAELMNRQRQLANARKAGNSNSAEEAEQRISALESYITDAEKRHELEIQRVEETNEAKTELIDYHSRIKNYYLTKLAETAKELGLELQARQDIKTADIMPIAYDDLEKFLSKYKPVKTEQIEIEEQTPPRKSMWKKIKGFLPGERAIQIGSLAAILGGIGYFGFIFGYDAGTATKQTQPPEETVPAPTPYQELSDKLRAMGIDETGNFDRARDDETVVRETYELLEILSRTIRKYSDENRELFEFRMQHGRYWTGDESPFTAQHIRAVNGEISIMGEGELISAKKGANEFDNEPDAVVRDPETGIMYWIDICGSDWRELTPEGTRIRGRIPEDIAYAIGFCKLMIGLEYNIIINGMQTKLEDIQKGIEASPITTAIDAMMEFQYMSPENNRPTSQYFYFEESVDVE